jgi:hypothetical protein
VSDILIVTLSLLWGVSVSENKGLIYSITMALLTVEEYIGAS